MKTAREERKESPTVPANSISKICILIPSGNHVHTVKIALSISAHRIVKEINYLEEWKGETKEEKPAHIRQ